MNRMKMVCPANGTIRAIIFWQGGEDARKEKDALKWKERFSTFVADLRRDLGNPNLAIVMIMLALHDDEAMKRSPYWQIVREQQRSVNISGVIKFDSDGYERKQDGVHFSARGQLAIGAALAHLLPAPETDISLTTTPASSPDIAAAIARDASHEMRPADDP